MAWFDKALKSVQDTAGKTAFEADKLVRSNREATVLSELQQKSQAKLVDLGQAALALHREGALPDPAVAALAAEISELEENVQQQKDKIEAIRNEQYQPGGHAQAPAAETHAEPVAPAMPAPVAEVHEPAEAPEAVAPVDAAPALVECPSCHERVKATATFCPECGSRLK